MEMNQNIVFDSNVEMVTGKGGDVVTSRAISYYIEPKALATADAIGVKSKAQLSQLTAITAKLGRYLEGMLKLFVMPFYSDAAILYDMIDQTQLSSSGDDSRGFYGISGDGTYYYSGIAIPSTEISDINNFSMGVYSIEDDNTASTVDMGSNDGTNEQSIAVRASGNFVVKNGTASISTSTPGTAKGHFVMNSAHGILRAYFNGIEVGTSTAVTGSLSSLQPIYLGALNNNGTAANFSPKTYSLCWVYNGLLEDNDIKYITEVLTQTTQQAMFRFAFMG